MRKKSVSADARQRSLLEWGTVKTSAQNKEAKAKNADAANASAASEGAAGSSPSASASAGIDRSGPVDTSSPPFSSATSSSSTQSAVRPVGTTSRPYTKTYSRHRSSATFDFGAAEYGRNEAPPSQDVEAARPGLADSTSGFGLDLTPIDFHNFLTIPKPVDVRLLSESSDITTFGMDRAPKSWSSRLQRRSVAGQKREAPSSLNRDLDNGEGKKESRTKANDYAVVAKHRTTDGSRGQLSLDLGQRNYHAVTCDECGMLYNPGVPQDDADHKRLHATVVLGGRPISLSAPSYVTQEWPMVGKMLVFANSHADSLAPVLFKKLNILREIVDKELCYACPRGGRPGPDEKTFVFVSTSDKVVGCAVAERVSVAYPSQTSSMQRQATLDQLFAGLDHKQSNQTQSSDAEREQSTEVVACDRKAPLPVRCGVSRIWVFRSNRRTGIASRLLDAVRTHFIYGEVIARGEVAFTQPTRDGSALFAAYSRNLQFPIFSPDDEDDVRKAFVG